MSGQSTRDNVWGNPEVRERLLDFHRSPEERTRRSEAQAARMLADPVKWTRGRGCYLDVVKAPEGRIWVRSSYEKAAVQLLEEDDRVLCYHYEPPFLVQGGRILPDFLVEVEGRTILVEVKAGWVLSLGPDHPVQERLGMSRALAQDKGWDFEIWTEEELHDYI